ncbi:MAG TPA: endonuclease MutS2, partial [Oceanithermus sp.]|nr:endonuclease MutS2 [Oceanithermus sp.]
REEAEARHARIEEAAFFPLKLGGVSDLRPLLARARRGEALSGPELLAAAGTLARAMELKAGLGATELSALKAVAERIGDHRGFVRAVERALDEEGEVKDEASEKLKKLRGRIRPLKRRIQERVYQLLDRHAEDLSDRFVTLRRGRYVLPVRAERVHRVPGVVLDRSSSGSTLFVEPLSVVPLNNELARLLLEEEAEVKRILGELTARLASDPGVDATLEALAELDLTEAARRLAEDWGLSRPVFGPPGRYALIEAFHPLIKNPVKNDLALDERRKLLLVSGPNMGGKTALLKTLGLAQAMAQSGLFVAARAAEIPFVRAILTDIGDEQDLLADLSTFASHLKRLKAILEEAGPDALVLVDELGTGTDPEEGAALGQAVLEELLKKDARGVVTTHLAPLKAFAAEIEGVENASMAFDLERFAPTYRLLLGVPGRSYAFAIAERLGFPKGPLERARALLGEGAKTAEALLARLEEEKRALEAELRALEAERRRAEQARRELEARLGAIEAERERILNEARAEADRLLLEAERQIKRAKERARSEAGK